MQVLYLYIIRVAYFTIKQCIYICIIGLFKQNVILLFLCIDAESFTALQCIVKTITGIFHSSSNRA